MGVTRCLRTHAKKANLEPYTKGLLSESEMIGRSGDQKPFVSLSVSAGRGSRRKLWNANQ